MGSGRAAAAGDNKNEYQKGKGRDPKSEHAFVLAGGMRRTRVDVGQSCWVVDSDQPSGARKTVYRNDFKERVFGI
jgi:hypothetical protein